MRGHLTVAIIFALSSFAQNTKSLPAPPDVSLQLSTEGINTSFILES